MERINAMLENELKYSSGLSFNLLRRQTSPIPIVKDVSSDELTPTLQRGAYVSFKVPEFNSNIIAAVNISLDVGFSLPSSDNSLSDYLVKRISIERYSDDWKRVINSSIIEASFEHHRSITGIEFVLSVDITDLISPNCALMIEFNDPRELITHISSAYPRLRNVRMRLFSF